MKKCTKCGVEKEDQYFSTYKGRLSSHCRLCRYSYDPIRKQRNRKDGLCECGNQVEGFFKKCCKCRDWARKWRDSNRDRINSNQRAKRLALKLQVFNTYGGCICKCCGETNLEFLSIDHVNNDGAKHRKTIFGKNKVGGSFYEWLKKNNFPIDIGLRVLCMNCNFSLGHFGYCPHSLVKCNTEKVED